jgi:TPR repeat protein
MQNYSNYLFDRRAGRGVVTSEEQENAPGLMLTRAANGDCMAQFELGEWLCKTVGLASAAFPWYLKSAEGGVAAAANQVAYMYLAGKGIEEDAGRAMRWALVAVAKGERDAVNIVKAARTVLTQDQINAILRRFRERFL